MGSFLSRNQVHASPRRSGVIAVAPAPMDSSLENSVSIDHCHRTYSNGSPNRNLSDSGRRSAMRKSRPGTGMGGMYPGLGRSRAGSILRAPQSRPDSHVSFKRGKEHHRPLPKIHPLTSFDLNNSNNSGILQQQQSSPMVSGLLIDDDCLLKKLPLSNGEPAPITLCPLCHNQYSKIINVPKLLICGHTYCSVCIDDVLRSFPPYLKCGVCGINTPVGPQCSVNELEENDAILGFIESKDFTTIMGRTKSDLCAECEKEQAIKYCSECSASFCESCSKQQHTGSRVRSKHKPVSITLKPRPQPTCKKHPGQSCVLYCETDNQPMCVLCKFYGQHKFHNYQLLNNSATSYRTALSKRLGEVERLEAELSKAVQSQQEMMEKVRQRAMEAQDKLEVHFSEVRNDVLAALERRETTLLRLLDKQVEVREFLLLEQRKELAAARGRALAAKEQTSRLMELNPISALLVSKHVNLSLDVVLKQSASFALDQEDDGHNFSLSNRTSNTQLLPLGLRPRAELAQKLEQILLQQGAILQLPEVPTFIDIHISTSSIVLKWRLEAENEEVTSDSTQVFVLQCFADVPLKYKKEKLANFNRRIVHNASILSQGDSGYHDGTSDASSQTSEAKGSNLPSIPDSLHNSRNVISLVTAQTPDRGTSDLQSVHSDTPVLRPGMSLQPGLSGSASMPKAVLRQDLNHIFSNSPVQTSQPTLAAKTSGALLSLPPLLTKTSEEGQTTASTVYNHESCGRGKPGDAGNYGDEGDAQSSDSSTSSLQSSGLNQTNAIKMDRFCKGFAFEDIYCGYNDSFTYSGIVAGATYYFRVRCRNAAGEGPWSDTYKCVILHNH